MNSEDLGRAFSKATGDIMKEIGKQLLRDVDAADRDRRLEAAGEAIRLTGILSKARGLRDRGDYQEAYNLLCKTEGSWEEWKDSKQVTDLQAAIQQLANDLEEA